MPGADAGFQLGDDVGRDAVVNVFAFGRGSGHDKILQKKKEWCVPGLSVSRSTGTRRPGARGECRQWPGGVGGLPGCTSEARKLGGHRADAEGNPLRRRGIHPLKCAMGAAGVAGNPAEAKA